MKIDLLICFDNSLEKAKLYFPLCRKAVRIGFSGKGYIYWYVKGKDFSVAIIIIIWFQLLHNIGNSRFILQNLLSIIFWFYRQNPLVVSVLFDFSFYRVIYRSICHCQGNFIIIRAMREENSLPTRERFRSDYIFV